MNSIIMILLINTIIALSGVVTPCSEETNDECCQDGTIQCCEGFVLQVQNETTATCVKCLAPGQACYQINRSCCPGYRCGSGGAVYPESRPGDRCILDQIIG